MAVLKTCDHCGKQFLTYKCYEKRKRKNRFCSKKCESEFRKLNNTRENWKGGHIGKTTGYKYIRIDGKDVGEHILVMEKVLGRRIEKGEIVHHKNGVKTDNRPENLEIMQRSDHSRMHATRNIPERSCKRCGKQRHIHARGLCDYCYGYILKNKELDKWERNTNQKVSS